MFPLYYFSTVNFTSARAVFFIVLGFYLALQFYLFRRVRNYIQKRSRGSRRAKLYCGAALGFFIVMFLPVVSIVLFGLLPHEPYPWPMRGELLWFAIWACGSTGLALVLMGYRWMKRLLGKLPPAPKVFDLGRREFLKAGAGAVAAAPFILSGYGALVGRRSFEVDHFEVPLNGLSGALAGLTVVQLTDIHVGPFMPPEELAAYVEAVNGLQPDFIALTGDFIASSPAEVVPCVDVLSALKARYGVYACLGNHDAYAGIEDELTRRFAEKGVGMLRNDAVTHRIGNTALNVLGIDDLRWGAPDFSRALAAAAKDPGEVRLLMSHRPEIFPDAAQNGVEITLSGHYHGGQVKLGPKSANLSVARLITPYAEGMFILPRRRSEVQGAKDSTLFVGRGIGITGLPIRINCPPQIAHLTLKKA
jgi:predicted MPP superfamily phosphohydrolase